MLSLHKASNSIIFSFVIHGILLAGPLLLMSGLPKQVNFSKELGRVRWAGKLSIQELSETTPLTPQKATRKAKKVLKRPKKKVIKKQIVSRPGKIRQGQNDKLSEYLGRIQSHIRKHQYRNRIASRLKLRGKVDMRFDLESPNKIKNIEVLSPSKYKALNQSALESIRRIRSIPDFPEDLSLKKIAVQVSIFYE